MSILGLNKAHQINSLNLNHLVALGGFGGSQEMSAFFGPSNTDQSFLATGMANHTAKGRLIRAGDHLKGDLGGHAIFAPYTDTITTNGERGNRATVAGFGHGSKTGAKCL